MFKGLGNLSSMLKQAQEVGGKLQALQEDLKKQRVVGQAGAGLVEVEANGLGQIVRVTLDPALVERRDREMLEDLIPSAVESGAGQSQATSRRSPARTDRRHELARPGRHADQAGTLNRVARLGRLEGREELRGVRDELEP